MGHFSDREDLRWAAALQDGPMQGLVALRLLLDSGLNDGSREALERIARTAVSQIDSEIADLRALIAEMRAVELEPPRVRASDLDQAAVERVAD
jgi:signal transduction histidine kinase